MSARRTPEQVAADVLHAHAIQPGFNRTGEQIAPLIAEAIREDRRRPHAMNEAGLDVIANRLLGFRSFDQNSEPTPDALSALSGSRAALRKLVKAAARMARDEIEAER